MAELRRGGFKIMSDLPVMTVTTLSSSSSPHPLCSLASPPPQPPPSNSNGASLNFWLNTSNDIESIDFRFLSPPSADYLKRMHWWPKISTYDTKTQIIFTCHIPSAFSLIYDMCPILSNFAVVFIKCHTWRWYWLDIIVKRPKWRSLLRRNGSFKRIHVKLYTI